MSQECKHGLRGGCAYASCGGEDRTATLNRLKGQRVEKDRIKEYAAQVAEAMDRRGPLAREAMFGRPYRPIPRGLAKFQTGYAGV